MNYEKFFWDVFRPQKADRFVFLEETPSYHEHDNWQKRHEMLLCWKGALIKLGIKIGFSVLQDVRYNPPADENAPFSRDALNLFKGTLRNATVFIAFSKVSISATLNELCNEFKTLRGASMPGIIKDMEETALAADYSKIQKRCSAVAEYMKSAEYAMIEFSTGHVCEFDLRFRSVIKDDGYCGVEKAGMADEAIINLPSGEVCQAPYEGEIANIKSKTNGVIPIIDKGKIALLHIEGNKIVNINGSPKLNRFFLDDPGRCNIAEFAIGLNDRAIIRGNELEDEKAGFHFAYGRSDHVGGKFGPEKFKRADKACHIDVVYAKESAIFVKNAWFINEDNRRTQIYKEGELAI